ncbi:MAG: alpha/beta hydrolase, partial [Verrucomicrobia subdivision 3 bacterium]|nr:alpha/beta hydrolase [Limisphaerales bacterium]
DFHEVLALIAPRLCFINAPLGDTNFKWRSVDKVGAAVWPVYRLYGCEENLQIAHPDCGHSFPAEIRERAYHLLDTVLK